MHKALVYAAALAATSPVAFGLSLLVAMWRGWWLFPAWEWFIVPAGVPRVSFWHFVALLIFVNAATAEYENRKDDRDLDWGRVFSAFIAPAFAWALLWFVHRQA